MSYRSEVCINCGCDCYQCVYTCCGCGKSKSFHSEYEAPNPEVFEPTPKVVVVVTDWRKKISDDRH